MRNCQILSVFQSSSIPFRFRCCPDPEWYFRICIRILLQVSDPTGSGSGYTTLLGRIEILLKTAKEKRFRWLHTLLIAAIRQNDSFVTGTITIDRINNKRTLAFVPYLQIWQILLCMRNLTSMVRWRLRSLSVQAESRLRSSSLAAWDLDKTHHVTENYVFTAFQLLLDQDFNPINQSISQTYRTSRKD